VDTIVFGQPGDFKVGRPAAYELLAELAIKPR